MIVRYKLSSTFCTFCSMCFLEPMHCFSWSRASPSSWWSSEEEEPFPSITSAQLEARDCVDSAVSGHEIFHLHPHYLPAYSSWELPVGHIHGLLDHDAACFERNQTLFISSKVVENTLSHVSCMLRQLSCSENRHFNVPIPRLSRSLCFRASLRSVRNSDDFHAINASPKGSHNRSIVLLRPGHEVRGIPAVWSCKNWSIAFCTFRRHFLGWAWLWTTVFFLQLARNTQSTFGDVLAQRWHWKKSRFERLSAHAEVASLLPSLWVSRLDLSSTRAIQKEKSISRWRKNASFDNTLREWSDERLSSSARPREWSSR